MTGAEAKEAFWRAVADPDPSSMEIAQDICLERGWKIWELGHTFVFVPPGIERARDAHMVRWMIDTHIHAGVAKLRAHIFYRYRNERWTKEISNYRVQERSELTASASEEAWYALGVMKQAEAEDKDAGQVAYILNNSMYQARGLSRIPPELNPTDPKEAFWTAVRDPSEGSTEVAQDIALENGWKLWQLGEEFAGYVAEGPMTAIPGLEMRFELDNTTDSLGAFYMKKDVGVEWSVGHNRNGPIIVAMAITYGEFIRSHRIFPPGSKQPFAWPGIGAARSAAAQEAWRVLKQLKRAYRERWSAAKFSVTDVPPDTTPFELNPMSKNPSDLAAARDKYKEFHRYDPKSEGEFPSSFKIPTKLLHAGTAKWITYRSSKTDPATLKLPKRPVDYIHEHDAGVETYIKDPHPDTDVPEEFTDVGALVKLGDCLGFCVVGCDGEEVEAEATTPLPELYSTPDGKCLFVIQSKKDVLAASWGGALGVYARGIDG